MTDLKQAAQQALEFLSHDMVAEDWPHQKRKDAVCDALRAALAEPEQEPVAWVEPKWLDPDTRGWPSDSFESVPIEGWLPLYTAPTPRKPQTTHWEGCEAVHPECRKPEQKPVAWMSNKDFNPIRIRIMSEAYDFADRGDSEGYNAIKVMCGDVQRMLPPQRKPLTEEEIVRLMVGEDRVQLLYAKPDDPYFSEFAQGAIRELVESGRAIERAHGIGEQHE